MWVNYNNCRIRMNAMNAMNAMNTMYDYVIVGGGPTGLALAQLLSFKRVLLLEKRDYLGGCHGVTRVHDGMMTEHAPRIYIDNFLMFTQLLNDMGAEFDDLFVKYNFSTASMMLEALRVLTAREIAALVWSFMTLNDSFKIHDKDEAYRKDRHEYERRLRLAAKLLSQSKHSSSRFPDVPQRGRS
jgi:phytoene dehydrogenase-like protein